MTPNKIDNVLKPIKQISFVASVSCIFLVLTVLFQSDELGEYFNSESKVESFKRLRAPIIIYLGITILALIITTEVIAAIIFTVCCRIKRINCPKCNEKMKIQITDRVYLVCPSCDASHKMHYMGVYGKRDSDHSNLNHIDSGF